MVLNVEQLEKPFGGLTYLPCPPASKKTSGQLERPFGWLNRAKLLVVACLSSACLARLHKKTSKLVLDSIEGACLPGLAPCLARLPGKKKTWF